ncbi:MAG TPA: hypothetical protein VNI20_11940 [Fimbriimonadaceae bacterium]|nr:hypothetical protein [Fimbriimonadaceae bacterium]
MSQSLRSALRSAAAVLGGLAVVGGGYLWMSQVLRADAFAKFHSTGVPLGAEMGVTLNNVDMMAYESGRLAVSAHVADVAVRRDRSQVFMTDVSAGHFHPEDGDPFQFDMKQATYFYFLERLSADTGAHVVNKDMDLVSDKFFYNKSDKTLLVHGSVHGTLNDGKVEAADLSLNTSTKDVSASNVVWKGELQDAVQEGQRKRWEIHGEKFSQTDDGKVQHFTNARATDGEVIVLANDVYYTKETDVLDAKGDVKYFGVDANMLCDEAVVYRKERRAVFTGNVRMVVKAEDNDKAEETDFPTIDRVTPDSLKTNPQGATKEQVDLLRDTDNLRKYPIKVIADKIEYWYKKGERHADITGSPFARQDLEDGWRLGWADSGFYDGEKETLTLKSPEDQQDVKVFYSIGDQYVASTVTLSTRKGDKSMQGTNMSAKMFFDEDEVPTKSGGGSTGGGTGGRT